MHDRLVLYTVRLNTVWVHVPFVFVFWKKKGYIPPIYWSFFGEFARLRTAMSQNFVKPAAKFEWVNDGQVECVNFFVTLLSWLWLRTWNGSILVLRKINNGQDFSTCRENYYQE